MSAIGAISTVQLSDARLAPGGSGMRLPQDVQLQSVHRPGESSGVAGYDFTGDPLADRVIATFASDPLGLGSLAGAMDKVSASFTFDPTRGFDQAAIPGTAVRIAPGNALSAVAPAEAARMGTSEFIARNQSTLARVYAGYADGLRSGASVHSAMSDMAQQLGTALRRDERGMTAFDHQSMAIEFQRQELIKDLKERVGDPKLIVAKLMSLTIAQGMVDREREKIEELRNLIISLLMGVQIPKGLVQRLQALGLGPLVEKIIQDAIGSGKSLSKSMQESIRALGEFGINISMLAEQNTEVGIREAEFQLEQGAKLARDGRLVDGAGRTLDAHAAQLDLGEVLRRRAAGLGGDIAGGGLRATAGGGGVVTNSPTNGAVGVA